MFQNQISPDELKPYSILPIRMHVCAHTDILHMQVYTYLYESKDIYLPTESTFKNIMWFLSTSIVVYSIFVAIINIAKFQFKNSLICRFYLLSSSFLCFQNVLFLYTSCSCITYVCVCIICIYSIDRHWENLLAIFYFTKLIIILSVCF